MIRAATNADIPAMVAMGERFTTLAGFDSHVGYDRDSAAALLAQLIADHVCLFGGDCMAGAVVTRHPFNAAHICAQELFWWSEGKQGVRLLDALEQAVRAKGAHSLAMVTIEAIRPDATARFYERRGFRPVERTFLKVFG